jgi:transcriptional regulator with XRE-family HTH domain
MTKAKEDFSDGSADSGMVAQYVGERVRSERLELNLNQEQLGGLSNTSASFISRLEKATTQPSFFSMLRVSKALGCRLEDFLPESPDKAIPRKKNDVDPELLELLKSCRGLKFSSHTLSILKTVFSEEKARSSGAKGES